MDRQERFNAEELKRQKAKNMRWKKPLCAEINLQKITTDLYEWQEVCEDLKWFDDEELEDALGDEEQAFEFKMAYSDLAYDIERALGDIGDWEGYISDYFDMFFVGIGAGNEDGGYLGYDNYEGDYFPLMGYGDDDAAVKESVGRLKVLTKDKLIQAAHDCFRLYHLYICLKYRMDCLDASIDILKERNGELLQTIKDIEKLYDEAEEESDHFQNPWETESTRHLDRMLEALPQEIWIQ